VSYPGHVVKGVNWGFRRGRKKRQFIYTPIGAGCIIPVVKILIIVENNLGGYLLSKFEPQKNYPSISEIFSPR
jgi:hypothetical protein